MVLTMPIWIWATALAGSTLMVQNFVKPRLPVYNLHVHKLPRLQRVQGEWATVLPTRVSLFNENYVPIDVRALQFDVFVANGEGKLQHVGNIQDRHQQNLAEGSYYLDVSPSCLAASAPIPQHQSSQGKRQGGTTSSSSNGTASTTTFFNKGPAVWQIGPRSDFDCHDHMYLKIPSLWNMLSGVTSLLKYWWRGSGRFVLPTTGVAHVQVNPTMQATISLICDNWVDSWSMQVQGVECTLHAVQPGFASLEQASAKLKQYAVQELTGFPVTGGVLLETQDHLVSGTSSQNSSKIWKDVVRAMEREEYIKLM